MNSSTEAALKLSRLFHTPGVEKLVIDNNITVKYEATRSGFQYVFTLKDASSITARVYDTSMLYDMHDKDIEDNISVSMNTYTPAADQVKIYLQLCDAFKPKATSA